MSDSKKVANKKPNLTTLVIGASANPGRYSNMAISRLVARGYTTKALGVKEENAYGIPISTEWIPYKEIHTVTLYLNPYRQKEYYDYIISLKPKRVIFNPGTENPEFYRLLDEKQIAYTEACTLVLLGTDQY